MMLACPECGSTDLVTLEIAGDDRIPDVLECEDCDAQFEDPSHDSAGY